MSTGVLIDVAICWMFIFVRSDDLRMSGRLDDRKTAVGPVLMRVDISDATRVLVMNIWQLKRFLLAGAHTLLGQLCSGRALLRPRLVEKTILLVSR